MAELTPAATLRDPFADVLEFVRPPTDQPGEFEREWHTAEAEVLAQLADLTAVVGPYEAARIMEWSN